MKVESLKTKLLDNAKKKIFEDLSNKIKNIKEEQKKFNTGLVQKNKNLCSFLGMIPYDDEIVESERKKTTKENYKFPGIVYAGKIKKVFSIPSRILREFQKDPKKYGFQTEAPFFLPIEHSSLVFAYSSKENEYIHHILETIAIKMMASLPNGLVRTIIIDKNAAGKNFPTLLTMNEKFREVKPLSEDYSIEKELLNLKNQINKITQSINMNGFKNIEEYNNKTDELPQPYKFLFISGFPSGFSKKATEALISILEAGQSAGIYVFMTVNYDRKFGLNYQIQGMPLYQILKKSFLFEVSDKPHDYMRRELIKKNINLLYSPLGDNDKVKEFFNTIYKINFETPENYKLKKYIELLNKEIEDANLRPVIPLEKVILPEEEMWQNKAGMGVAAPFAKNGIENVYLSLGVNEKGETEPVHHGIIGGATGSGKTVTLHSMIMNLCMRYSPKELRFWLLDYKEGTEFALYKDFPYMDILSMESEIEFGQEVLLRAIKLMEERGKLFKQQKVANLHGYNSKVPEEEKLPRILIIIDEFQNLFPKNAQVSAISNERIDRILRLGRSFGINLLLSTQTLKGIDLDQQILSNMPLRIGLKMDAKDAVKIFGENNTAPIYLRFPGEGIYNPSYGDPAENINFQGYFADTEIVKKLSQKLTKKISKDFGEDYFNKLVTNRFVYVGDIPGDIKTNTELMKTFKETEPLNEFKFYIGEPAGLSKEHAYLKFNNNDYADNLLIIGSDIEKAVSIALLTNLQINKVKQNKRIYFANFNKSFNDLFEDYLKQNNINIYDNIDSDKMVEEIYQEFQKRKELGKEEIKKLDHIFATFFFIESSKIFNDVTYSKTSPLAKIKEMLSEASEYNIHFIVYTSDFSSLQEADLSKYVNKFKKKIAIKGGNSLKIFAANDFKVEFSKAVNVSIGFSGETKATPFKFKPYSIESINSIKNILENNHGE